MVIKIFNQDEEFISSIKMPIMPRIGEKIWVSIDKRLHLFLVNDVHYFIDENSNEYKETYIYCELL